MRKTFNQRAYRSGLEDKIAKELALQGVRFQYEPPGWVPYSRPQSKYKPDFLLPNGIIIETKGQFLSSDRSKHKLIKEQHPDLDIRFVFSNSKSRIGKKSKTTYAMWCERNGFLYADKSIPPEWIEEKLSATQFNKATELCKREVKQKKS